MVYLYRLLTTLGAPLIALYLRLRRSKGREDHARFQERMGHADLPRPRGKLVWCHAASVGEVLSVITLLTKLRERHPNWTILLTSGTVTSAQLVRARLTEGILHQYVPVDRWPYVSRFLDHWKPNLALWVESELWPNMLSALAERRVPTILLNGRMSEKSYKRWRMIQGGIKPIMESFSLGLAQTGAERARFAALGMKDVRAIGNLKFAADPLPYSETDLKTFLSQLSGRPVWLMASTHPGEDEIALNVHRKLRLHWPDILTIIVPRHPLRSAEISTLLQKETLCAAHRSRGEPITNQTEIYLADTMGELGLFYRACPVCCLAGSFTWGGHNPVEPAQLGCATVFGPKMDNFVLMADDMLGAGAALQVMDEKELADTIERLLNNPAEVTALAESAKKWTESKHAVLGETLKLLEPYFTEHT